MLWCTALSVLREVPWMINVIGVETKVRARHIHCAILPEIIPNTHRDGNERGFNAAAAD